MFLVLVCLSYMPKDITFIIYMPQVLALCDHASLLDESETHGLFRYHT